MIFTIPRLHYVGGVFDVPSPTYEACVPVANGYHHMTGHPAPPPMPPMAPMAPMEKMYYAQRRAGTVAMTTTAVPVMGKQMIGHHNGKKVVGFHEIWIRDEISSIGLHDCADTFSRQCSADPSFIGKEQYLLMFPSSLSFSESS